MVQGVAGGFQGERQVPRMVKQRLRVIVEEVFVNFALQRLAAEEAEFLRKRSQVPVITLMRSLSKKGRI